jgi:predicted DNA-binding transcriptional regulator YafY
MRASRLLSLLLLLQSGGPRSAPALARALAVSTRTILRDIDHLCEAGVPIWTARGREGGFHLREGWSTQLTGLTTDEAQALSVAGVPIAAADLGLGASALSARTKVLASLPTALRTRAQEVGARLHVDPAPWYRSEPTPPTLATVASAVWSRSALNVEYQSWTRTSKHILHPLGLVLKAGVWYVVAARADDDTPRTYKLSSVLTVSTRTETFRAPRGFALQTYWRDAVHTFERAVYAGGHVTLRVLPTAQQRLAEMDSAVAQAARESAGTDPEREGWLRVVIPMESIDRAARALLALGAEIEVLAPAALRARMRTHASALTALYSTS